MTYADACAWLFSLERRGVRLGLDRIVGALREHGDPQLTFPSVLIGGTNGKGSTSAIVASCLQAAGRRTGLFTSPHLIDFRERIRIDGRMIPEGDVVALAGAIRPTVDRWELSFFEATTLLAFLWFRERGVDAAAVEVGLGGRLDASRPVRALVTVVTTIDLDHVKILGETRGAIAGEKAGIFRAGAPAVVSVRHSDALAVLDARARLIGIPIYERRRCLRVSDIALTPRGSRFLVQARPGQPGPREPLEIDLALAGAHQVSNAATAILALSLLPAEMGIDARAIRAGAARARWPGRAEVVRQDPLVICDVGHNPEGAESLSRLLAQLLVRRATAMRAVVGMVEGKDHTAFLRALAPRLTFVHACTPPTDRAVSAEALAEICGTVGLPASAHASPAEAFDAAEQARTDREGILVTGSFYTVGPVFERLGIGPRDPLWNGAAAGNDPAEG